MTAPVRIEAEAWSDLRFATLARLMGFAEPIDALIRTARLWGWQTEHYTPEAPTYVVDIDTIESAIGPGAAPALVRARLAEELPEGYRIRGSAGRIEWLWRTRQAGRAGGEATKRKYGNKTGPAAPAPASPPLEAPPSPLIPALTPDQIRDLPPARDPVYPERVPDIQHPAAVPTEPREAQMLLAELEQARGEAAAELGVEVQPLTFADAGKSDLACMLAAARASGRAELAKLVAQARHAIAMAKLETVTGEKPFEWFTGAVFRPNNFRRLVGKTATTTARAGPRGSAERALEPVRKIKTL